MKTDTINLSRNEITQGEIQQPTNQPTNNTSPFAPEIDPFLIPSLAGLAHK